MIEKIRIYVSEDGERFEVICSGEVIGSSGYSDDSLLTEAEKGIEDIIEEAGLTPKNCNINNFNDALKLAKVVSQDAKIVGWNDESDGDYGVGESSESAKISIHEFEELIKNAVDVTVGSYHFFIEKQEIPPP